MKSLHIFLFFVTNIIYSQIGIGTTTPNGALDIVSSNQGLIIPRVALTSLVAAAPVAAAPVAYAAPAPSSTPVAEKPKAAAPQADNLITIKSPMIGTFYRKQSPDKPNLVDVGSEITTGTVLCIVEAMKLFNEIESEVSGKIVKVLVEDASPVEFDQPLFLVEPA